ncbi:hypothetical protein [Embleya sp. NPDC050493]|uniref:hypothetical protein n=1 Tax=Embleya sp. NPDC050493 TaxID=3363989 RepID=UPI0037B45F20
MPGPAARPAALRLVEGRSPGRDSGGRPVAPHPAYTRPPPAAPIWLPCEAAAEWRRVVPELQRLKFLKLPDRATRPPTACAEHA